MYQLNLFHLRIAPCGRRDVPFCEVIQEHSSTADINILRCIDCGSIAPITAASS